VGGYEERDQADRGSDAGVGGEGHREQHRDDDGPPCAGLVEGDRTGYGDDHPGSVRQVSEDGESAADELAVIEQVVDRRDHAYERRITRFFDQSLRVEQR
jgi:hypothetical protein